MALKYDQQAITAARMILDHPIVNEIFDDMEADYLNNAVNAKATNPVEVAAFLAEVRAIRKFRDNLKFLMTHGEAELQRNKPTK